jgi:hypothetical protein
MDVSELIDLEHKGWHALSGDAGAEFYDAFLTDDAVMVVPVGVLERDACIAAFEAAAPWSRFELSDMRVLPLGEDGAIVTYRATAEREGHPEYTALVSTTYVRQDGEWLIAFHQQTPVVVES